jgi:hypothetical protein
MKEILKIVTYFQWVARFLSCSQTFLICLKRCRPGDHTLWQRWSASRTCRPCVTPTVNLSYCSERCLWLLTESQTSTDRHSTWSLDAGGEYVLRCDMLSAVACKCKEVGHVNMRETRWGVGATTMRAYKCPPDAGDRSGLGGCQSPPHALATSVSCALRAASGDQCDCARAPRRDRGTTDEDIDLAQGEVAGAARTCASSSLRIDRTPYMLQASPVTPLPARGSSTTPPGVSHPSALTCVRRRRASLQAIVVGWAGTAGTRSARDDWV